VSERVIEIQRRQIVTEIEVATSVPGEGGIFTGLIDCRLADCCIHDARAADELAMAAERLVFLERLVTEWPIRPIALRALGSCRTHRHRQLTDPSGRE